MKRVVSLTLLAFALIGFASAQAEDYPTRSIRWIVGYPPAGTTDILARVVGAALRGGGNAAPSPLGGMLSALSSPASLSRDGGLTASVSGATSASLFAGAARRGFASSIPGGTPLDAITGRILALGQLWDNPGATHSVSAALGVPCEPA